MRHIRHPFIMMRWSQFRVLVLMVVGTLTSSVLSDSTTIYPFPEELEWINKYDLWDDDTVETDSSTANRQDETTVVSPSGDPDTSNPYMLSVGVPIAVCGSLTFILFLFLCREKGSFENESNKKQLIQSEIQA